MATGEGQLTALAAVDDAAFAGEDGAAVGHRPAPAAVSDPERVGAAFALDDEADPVEALVEDREGAVAAGLRFVAAGVLDRELFAVVAAGAAERFVRPAVAVEVVVADAAVESVAPGSPSSSSSWGEPTTSSNSLRASCPSPLARPVSRSTTTPWRVALA